MTITKSKFYAATALAIAATTLHPIKTEANPQQRQIQIRGNQTAYPQQNQARGGYGNRSVGGYGRGYGGNGGGYGVVYVMPRPVLYQPPIFYNYGYPGYGYQGYGYQGYSYPNYYQPQVYQPPIVMVASVPQVATMPVMQQQVALPGSSYAYPAQQSVPYGAASQPQNASLPQQSQANASESRANILSPKELEQKLQIAQLKSSIDELKKQQQAFQAALLKRLENGQQAATTPKTETTPEAKPTAPTTGQGSNSGGISAIMVPIVLLFGVLGAFGIHQFAKARKRLRAEREASAASTHGGSSP